MIYGSAVNTAPVNILLGAQDQFFPAEAGLNALEEDDSALGFSALLLTGDASITQQDDSLMGSVELILIGNASIEEFDDTLAAISVNPKFWDLALEEEGDSLVAFSSVRNAEGVVAGCGPKARRHRRLLARSGRTSVLRDLEGNFYTPRVSINTQSNAPVEGVIDVRHRIGYVSSCELAALGLEGPPEEGFALETSEVTYHVHSCEIETSGEEVVRYAMRLVG